MLALSCLQERRWWKQKNTANKFGGIIDTYPISEAVEDGAIVPILYEGRLAVQDVNRKVLDKSVDMVMEDLEEYQRADLKKKNEPGRVDYQNGTKHWSNCFWYQQTFSVKLGKR